MTINIRESVAENDQAAFWTQLRAYHERDILPDPEDEDRAYFLGDAYRERIQKLHDREHDKLRYLFFTRDGRDIGFAMPVIYGSEDGKCFLLEFCVYPEYRGNGTGSECARTLLRWAREQGAAYAELNYGSDSRRLRFWERLGFVRNGADEWGDPLLLLPPKEELPITVKRLEDPCDWQLLKLINGFLLSVGEEPMTEEKQARLQEAVRREKIVFFLAKRGYRAVGLCSAARCWSSFACADTAVLDDFFVEPAFRGKGIAHRLVRSALDWCLSGGISTLTVCCAPCDEAMYQKLGFTQRLGTTWAKNI